MRPRKASPKNVGWSSPPSIIATRRLRLSSIAGLQPLHLASPLRGLTDAVQGRDRSSSSELRTLDSIDARFHSLKTRFRVVVLLLSCHRTSRSFDHRPTCFRLEEGGSVFEVVWAICRWSVRGSNPRPPACKADALPAELTPQVVVEAYQPRRPMRWAWKDLNFRPHAYQACALTN